MRTAPSEANVKTNRTTTTKSTYYKEWTFASNSVFFFEEEEEEEFVLVLEPLKKSYVDVKTTQMSIFVFFVTAGV